MTRKSITGCEHDIALGIRQHENRAEIAADILADCPPATTIFDHAAPLTPSQMKAWNDQRRIAFADAKRDRKRAEDSAAKTRMHQILWDAHAASGIDSAGNQI